MGRQQTVKYLGGKYKIAGWIHETLLPYTRDNTTYLEPFLGGGSVAARLAPHFLDVHLGDIHEDLILMWHAAQQGWIPPHAISRADYDIQRVAQPSPLRGFVGFAGSYRGKWFGSYGAQHFDRHWGKWSYEIPGQSKIVAHDAAAFRHAHIECCSYDQWTPSQGWLVYCDPPYQDTTVYRGHEHFDHHKFWRVAATWVENGADVIVSESVAPDDWRILRTRTRGHNLQKKASIVKRARTENLYVHSRSRVV